MVIYEIKNNKNEKRYIGQTSNNFIYREYHHRYYLKNNNHRNPHLQNAWNKYGEDAFEFNIIEKCNSIEELNKREKYWVDKYGDYNLRSGGLNDFMDKETKEKLRKFWANEKGIKVHQYDLKGNYIQSYNSIKNAERKTEGNWKGIKNCCEKKSGKSGSSQWRYNKKEKIEEYNNTRSDKGTRKKTYNCKPVIQLDKKGNKINEFFSIAKASEETGANKINIGLVCKGKRKTCGGYKWKYKE